MYIVATFEHSLHLELLITELEHRGIPSKSILALPLEKRAEDRKLFDSIHHADGISLFDGAFALGSAFMVVAVIYGFVLEWGPIIWGLLGLIVGSLVGFLMDFFIGRMREKPKRILQKKPLPTEVVLMINTFDEKFEMVERTLWEHNALGVARLDRNN